MGTVLLKLAGPLQAWGSDSRFTERKTRHEPTKSGIVGLLAAALGRKREEPIEDLAALPVAVRIDQPGRYEKDFQTARTRKYDTKKRLWVADRSLPLSNRYYLSDAVFVVAVELPDEMLSEVVGALEHPAFPLYLGRRSCPPSERILLRVDEHAGLVQSLEDQPWEASSRLLKYKNKDRPTIACEVLRDALHSDVDSYDFEMVHDRPISFSQEHRVYDWRTVVHTQVSIQNPFYEAPLRIAEHAPMELLGEE